MDTLVATIMTVEDGLAVLLQPIVKAALKDATKRGKAHNNNRLTLH
jgi:hypothetical protein